MDFDFLNVKKHIKDKQKAKRNEERRKVQEQVKEELRIMKEEREKEWAERKEEEALVSTFVHRIIDARSAIKSNIGNMDFISENINDGIKRYRVNSENMFYTTEMHVFTELEPMCIFLDDVITKMRDNLFELQESHKILIQAQSALSEIKKTSKFGIPSYEDYVWDDMTKEIARAQSEIYPQLKNFVEKFQHSAKQQVFDYYREVIDQQSTQSVCKINSYCSETYFEKGHRALSEELKLSTFQVKNAISEMKKVYELIVRDSPDKNKWDQIYEAEHQKLPELEKQVDAFVAFSQKMSARPICYMMDEYNYGEVHKDFLDSVSALEREEAQKYVAECEQYFKNVQVSDIYAIDLEKVIRCIWFYAKEKPFSEPDCLKAKKIFRFLCNFKEDSADMIIAEMYVQKAIGGEDALFEYVRPMLRYQDDVRILSLMASSLMWMNAYETEKMILRHMLTTGKKMTGKMQERLHTLTNGGGKAPSGFDVKSSSSEFYFDVSALAWRDDEYVGLFENLAFQDKNLTYSLAIRDENKELFIPQGINVPSNDLVLKKFSSVFTDEYGNSVTVRSANCVALSGSGEEKIDGILASSNECNQMGILIHIARIGKKLIIKFYTLFIPAGSDLAAQKQQALSIYKKLSPSVTMWESSLKDTMLMAVEQILNSNVQGGGIINEDPGSGGGNEPIF